MAKVLSPLRIARQRRTSVTNVEETQEIDFALSLGQGIEMFAIEFGLRGHTFVPVDDVQDQVAQLHMSVHAETGALEGAVDAFPADNFILNSEIIAETTFQVNHFTSSIPAASPSTYHGIFLQPISWNFVQLTGKPLLIAQNLIFRTITSVALMNATGPQATYFYRYVELSTQELAEQVTLRR